MTTQDFLRALEPYLGKALIFDLGETHVNPGYHVTEVKAATVHAMDCGGQGSEWSETTLQLWVPVEADDKDGYMSVGKFLGIYRRVAASVPIVGSAEMRVEYGEVGAPAVSYLVEEFKAGEDALTVSLTPPAVTCKAIERSVGAIPVVNQASGCCIPAQTSCCA